MLRSGLRNVVENINKSWLLCLMALLFGLAFAASHAFCQDIGDLNGDREFNRLDYFPLIFGNAEGIKPGPVFKDLVERFTNRPQTLPGSFVGIGGVARISATPTMRDGQEVRVLLLDRSKVRVSDKPTNSSFSGVSVRIVSGGKIPTNDDPAGTKWMTKTFRGTSSTFAQRDFNPTTGATQVTVAWGELYAGFNAAGDPIATLVYPRSVTGNFIRESTVILKPDIGNFAARNLRFTPPNPKNDATVTAIVDIESLVVENEQPYTVIANVDGTDLPGVSLVAMPGQTTTAVVLPTFTGQNKTVPVVVRVQSSITEATLGDNTVSGSVTFTAPPTPTPDARLASISFSQNGAVFVPSVVVGISATSATTATITGKLDGFVVSTKSVSRAGGNTTAPLNLDAVTVAAGAHTYVASIAFSPAVTEVTLVNNAVTGTFTFTPTPPSNFFTQNLRINSTNLVEGMPVTPTIEVGGTTTTTRTIVLVESINGSVNDGGRSVVIQANNSGLQTITLPSFILHTGTMTLTVQINSPVTQDPTDDSREISFTVSPQPAGPAPKLVGRTAMVNPGSPAPGATVVPSITVDSTATSSFTYSATGTVNGQNPSTITGTIAAGSQTTTITMPVIIAQSGSNLYRAVVSVIGTTATAEVTKAFTVPASNVSVTGATTPTSTLQDATFDATVTYLATNVGAPKKSIGRVSAGASVLATAEVQFGIGDSVTATMVFHILATSPAISPLSFTIDGSSTITRSFQVIQPDVTLTSIAMASTATAGTTINATVTGNVRDLAVTKTVKYQLRANSTTGTIIATGSITFSAGTNVTSSSQTNVLALAGTTSVFGIVDSANTVAERDETNNVFGPKGITVTAQPPGTAPAVPTNLSATPASGSAMINWTATNATGYVVRTQAIGSTTVATAAANNNFATLSGLSNDQTYAISVRSVNSVGASTWTSPINITPGEGGIQITHYFGNKLTAPAVVDERSVTGTTVWSLASSRPMAKSTAGEWVHYGTTGKSDGSDRDFNLVQYGNTSGSSWTFIQQELVNVIRVNGTSNSVAIPIRKANSEGAILPPTDKTIRTGGSTHFVGTRASDLAVRQLNQSGN